MAEENKTALRAAQVDAALQTLEGWTRSEAVLARHFVFHTFEEMTAFLTHLVRAITAQTPPISASIPGCKWSRSPSARRVSRPSPAPTLRVPARSTPGRASVERGGSQRPGRQALLAAHVLSTWPPGLSLG